MPLIDPNIVKAKAALSVAQSIPRKTIRVPQGMRGEDLRQRISGNKHRTKTGVSTEEVLKLHSEGMRPVDIAKKFRVSPQTISYHLKPKKEL